MITLDKVGLLVCGSRPVGGYSSSPLPGTDPYRFYHNKDHIAFFDTCMHRIINNIVTAEKQNPETPNFNKGDILIISGAATGPDDLASIWSRINKFNYLEMPADWDRHGKSAGYIRNAAMECISKYVFAAYDGVSRGTAHTIALAKKHKKKIKTVNFL